MNFYSEKIKNNEKTGKLIEKLLKILKCKNQKQSTLKIIFLFRVKENELTGTVESKLTRDAQRETELLHSRLRDIAQAVINDDQVSGGFDDKLNGVSSPVRSRSPIRRAFGASSRPDSRTGSPFADATFSAVQAALNKRQLQVDERFRGLILS